MKKLFTAVLMFIAIVASAQQMTSTESREALNNYKYIIVPTKFSFQKDKNQYNLNLYTKMYFEKYGFTVFYDTDLLPIEAAGDNCNKLFADVVSDSNMFITRLTVILRDCLNKEVFRTDTGSNREKDYATTYRLALREAFMTFDTFTYEYNGNDGIRKQVGDLPQTASTLKTKPDVKEAQVIDQNTLFAQPTENGFQLVDTTPKVIYKLKKTSSDQVFIAEKNGQTGTLIEKGKGKWVFEYYLDGTLKTEEISVKF